VALESGRSLWLGSAAKPENATKKNGTFAQREPLALAQQQLVALSLAVFFV
jgi:hypothetical protein